MLPATPSGAIDAAAATATARADIAASARVSALGFVDGVLVLCALRLVDHATTDRAHAAAAAQGQAEIEEGQREGRDARPGRATGAHDGDGQGERAWCSRRWRAEVVWSTSIQYDSPLSACLCSVSAASASAATRPPLSPLPLTLPDAHADLFVASAHEGVFFHPYVGYISVSTLLLLQKGLPFWPFEGRGVSTPETHEGN